MSAVAADPHRSPPRDAFVIGAPVGRMETLLLPLARLPDLLEPDEGDRPRRVSTVAKLAGVILGVGVGVAAGSLGLVLFGARLLVR